MKLIEISKILEAQVWVGEEKLDKEISKCGASDLMSDILNKPSDDESIFLTGQVSNQAIKTAIVAGVGAVVFVRDKKPSQEIINMAKSEQIPILSSPFSMFVSCGRLYSNGLIGLNGKK